MKLKNIFRLFGLIGLISIFSCSEDNTLGVISGNPTEGTIPTFTNLQEFFDSNVPTPTEIAFDPGVANTFTTSSGNVTIALPANAVNCGGTPCPGGSQSLTVSITEYLDLDQMFLGNVQTESNQNLLVTGGAFNWDITAADGSTVTLNTMASATINVQTNVTGFENDLTIFTGETSTMNNLTVVNWILEGNQESFFEQGLFNLFGIDLGLVNCDALYDIAANNPTQFTVDVVPANNIATSHEMVWLFISDFPSVINITTVNNGIFSTYDNSIPNGLNGTLVAVALDEQNQLMYGFQDITVMGDDAFEVDVTYGTEEGLITLIQAQVN